MNISVLENLKLVENDHRLKILVINEGLNISVDELLQLKDIGDITVAVENNIEAGFLIGKFRGLKYTIVLSRRIPITNYDILISDCFTDITRLLAKNLKIKYLCFMQYVRNFNLTNYYEFEENSYRITVPDKQHHENKIKPPAPPPIPIQNDDEMTSNDVNATENDASNYEILIKELASTEIKYDKYKINYLHPAIPGKISIIMIVSELNNNFADVIRDIRAQGLPAFEIIVIDNAAGFRNNVKPDIRYGTKMPIDFCEYHAKELTSGEYIITLNQDSEAFDVMTAINQGKFETR